MIFDKTKEKRFEKTEDMSENIERLRGIQSFYCISTKKVPTFCSNNSKFRKKDLFSYLRNFCHNSCKK